MHIDMKAHRHERGHAQTQTHIHAHAHTQARSIRAVPDAPQVMRFADYSAQRKLLAANERAAAAAARGGPGALPSEVYRPMKRARTEEDEVPAGADGASRFKCSIM